MNSFAKAWIVAVLAPWSLPALTQECATIDGDLDRLACYDKASGRTPAITQSEPTSSAWRVTEQVSPLTDDRNVMLSTESEEAIDCRFGRQEPVLLIVRCIENSTAIIFGTACHMTSSDYNDYGDVSYRTDGDPAKTASMEESSDNKSLGLWEGRKSIPVIKSLFGKRKLIARMTPFNENPFTVNFDISGLEEAIKPLRAECKW